MWILNPHTLLARIAVPQHLRKDLLDKAHRGRMSGHFSGKRTMQVLCGHGGGMGCMRML